MAPLLSDHEAIFINRIVYHLDSIGRGDVVVFDYPLDGTKLFIKRIVALPGDISGGVELSHQARSTLFGGVSVVYGAVNIYQLYGDWSDHWSDRFGSTSLDLSAHGSPGSIDDLNTSAALSAFTSGQVKKASYVYGQANITRQTELPFGTSLVTQLTSQYAGTAIPESQEIALGGPTAVRGYTIDDGAWDDGAVLRDELHGLLLPLGANGTMTRVKSVRSS